jgi:hypothetical protein
MSLLAEEIVEEWLNRHGFFTIRGVRQGAHEIDILAIRPRVEGLECRHVEVQASARPIGYVTGLAIADPQGVMGKASLVKRRTSEQMSDAVRAWVDKKFRSPNKDRVRRALAPGPWTYELVAHNVRYEDELRLIQAEGVKVHRLSAVVADLVSGQGCVIASAAGYALAELVALELKANDSTTAT